MNSATRNMAHTYESGSQVIASLQAVQPQQAETLLTAFFNSLVEAPPRIDVYFSLLEMSRPLVATITDAFSAFYQGKPLPLHEIEADYFDKANAIWLKIAEGYSFCAKHISPEGKKRLHLITTCLQRCIHYVGQSILEHQRCYREYHQGLWLDLHHHYRLAEVLGLEQLTLPDALDQQARSSSCASTYIAIVLTEMSGCYSLSSCEQRWIYRWAVSWASLVMLRRVRTGEALPYYIVDLSQDCALRQAYDCFQIEPLRSLETARLIDKIKQIKQQLANKATADKLMIAEDCTIEDCARLLPILIKRWSQAHSSRKFRRFQATGHARLSSGFESMYYHIAGRPFASPEVNAKSPLTDQNDDSEVLWIEDWALINQSANGFGLARDVPCHRIGHGQLLTLCPHDGKRFLLARNRWQMQEQNGKLVIGLKVLPGLPTGIAVRRISVDSHPPDFVNARYQAAFMLSGTSASGQDTFLVLPGGWFVEGQPLEIMTDTGKQRVRLTHKMDQGTDFDLVSFTPC